mgnify:CR=1 FL=1
MDIQKEREAFETWYRKNYDNSVIDDSEFSEILDEYESNYYWVDELNQSWMAWQAVTAQAVPEGFVVLKISDVREILSNASDAMDAESPSSVFTQTGIPSTWYDHHLVAEKNILDAIKAQEPTND